MNAFEYLQAKIKEGSWPILKAGDPEGAVKEGILKVKELEKKEIEIPSTLAQLTAWIYFASEEKIPQRQIALQFGRENQFHNSVINKLAVQYPELKFILQRKLRKNKYGKGSSKLDLEALSKKFKL